MSYLLHISRVCLKCSNQMAFCVSTHLQVDLDADLVNLYRIVQAIQIASHIFDRLSTAYIDKLLRWPPRSLFKK